MKSPEQISEAPKQNVRESKKEETGMIFNPELEITEKDWEQMKGILERDRGGELGSKLGFWDYFRFPDQAMAMKVLFPDRLPELQLNDEVFQKLAEQLEEYRKEAKEPHKEKGPNWSIRDFTQQAMRIKMLFPEEAPKLQIDEKMWGEMKKYLEGKRAEANKEKHWGGHSGFSDHALAMAIIFPDRISELKLDDRIWEWMKSGFEKERKENNWYRLSTVASEMKLLFPKRTSELPLDKKTWEEMKKATGLLRCHKQWDYLANHAMNLKILTAQKVKIGGRGIEFGL